MYDYINKYLSPHICGYRRGYSAQFALCSLTECWRKALDNNQHVGAILMDLSKAFDTINHKLLVAKLSAYGFSKSALTLVYSYLTGRCQRTRINTAFST